MNFVTVFDGDLQDGQQSTLGFKSGRDGMYAYTKELNKGEVVMDKVLVWTYDGYPPEM